MVEPVKPWGYVIQRWNDRINPEHCDHWRDHVGRHFGCRKRRHRSYKRHRRVFVVRKRHISPQYFRNWDSELRPDIERFSPSMDSAKFGYGRNGY